MMYPKKKDPLTGETFTPRRFNQKFASKQNQIIFNNNKARQKRLKKSSVDRTLDKNRTVLERLVNQFGDMEYSKDFLSGAGFDFRFFSHSVKIGERPCQVVYEYCLIKEQNNKFKIKKLKS